MPEQRGYRSISASSRERATTYSQRPYVRPARGLPFGPAQRSVCHHPAPSRRYGRGPLHSLRRSKGDKAGRRRRPRPSGGGIGRLKERFLIALFYGLLTRSQERRWDACIQLAPVAVGIRATLGVRGVAKEREGLLVALWHLPPLEALGLGVVPTHALELCHCEDSAPRLTNSLGLCYMDTYHGWLLSTPLSTANTARSLFTGVRGRGLRRTPLRRSSTKSTCSLSTRPVAVHWLAPILSRNLEWHSRHRTIRSLWCSWPRCSYVRWCTSRMVCASLHSWRRNRAYFRCHLRVACHSGLCKYS